MAKKSLLLVDADSKSLRMLEVSLRKSGFSVTTAIHAADAREKLRHAAHDLIITDTKLPGDETGFDFVAKLKAQPETASIPIIFLSSENRLDQKVTGLELGVEDYLTKPIYIKEVLTRVRVLLDKREKQTLERRERSSFSGLLGDMGLVDLMQTVEIGRKTGRLKIDAHAGQGQVSFKEGKVTNARSGRLAGERAFYRMLVWNEGVFSMEFGAFDEADVIELSTQGLLMEGMRRVDEWGRLIEQLPPLDHVFEIDFNELVERLAEIPDEINLLLRLFDGRRTMLGVVDETDFGDLEALEIASKLYFEGLIFDVSDREPVALAQPHKVEAWLSEPAGAVRDDGDDDEDHDGQLLVPNDTLPPMAVRPSNPPAASGDNASILAPPAGAAAPPSAEDAVTLPTPAPMPTTMPMATVLPPRSDPVELSVPCPPTPRPLPAPASDVTEARAVVSRAEVGATVWSSAQKSPDHEWEDVVAPADDATPSRRALSSITAPPPPPLLPMPVSLTPSPAVESRTRLAAPTTIEAPPAGAAELARDLGLSDDELAIALSAHDAEVTAPPARTADEGQDLALSIAAQLEQALPPELSQDNGGFPDKEPLDDTNKGRRKKSPPPPPPTLVPSATPQLHNGLAIQEPRPELDVEPLVVDRLRVGRPLAAAVFIVGFVGVASIIVFSGNQTGPVIDAGANPPEAIVDAGSALVEAVVDAGQAQAKVVDAGTAAAPAASDAGPAMATRTGLPLVDPLADYATHLKAGEGAAKKGDFGRSVRSYKAALALEKNSVAAHLGLGNAYYELDNLPAALLHLEQARLLAPKDAQVFVHLGAVYQSSGRKSDAIRAYESYLDLAPDGKFARDVKGILRGLKN